MYEHTKQLINTSNANEILDHNMRTSTTLDTPPQLLTIHVSLVLHQFTKTRYFADTLLSFCDKNLHYFFTFVKNTLTFPLGPFDVVIRP